MDDFEKSFQRVIALLKEKKWPGVEVSQSWGTPSLKVKGKMLFRIREPGVGVLMCNVEAKEMLMMVAPHIYFELPHYKGYPAVLVHMNKIDDDELAEMIEEYWRKIAPKKLVAEFDGVTPPAETKAKSKSRATTKAGAPKAKPGPKSSPAKVKVLNRTTLKKSAPNKSAASTKPAAKKRSR
jgi:hypothetical protein